MNVRVLFLAAVLISGLTACGATGSSAGEQGADTSPTATVSVVALPESVLAPIPGMEFDSSAATDDERVAAFVRGGSTAAGQVAGLISRELKYKGQILGGIELVRFKPDLAQAPDELTSRILAEFGQTTPTQSAIGDRTIWQVERARGQNVGAVAWMSGSDLMLIYSDTADHARQIAATYPAP